MVTKRCLRLFTYLFTFFNVCVSKKAMYTLCFLRECRACLMVSYSSPCSVSVMARQDESAFNLSSFIAAQRKEFQSKEEDRACLAWGLCWSAGPEREFGLGLGVWGLEFRNLEKSREQSKGFIVKKIYDTRSVRWSKCGEFRKSLTHLSTSPR